MNNKRRELLRSAVVLMERVSGIVSRALEEEQDCLDNMPENLLDSDRCQKMDLAIDRLDEASEQIDKIIECIEEACE